MSDADVLSGTVCFVVVVVIGVLVAALAYLVKKTKEEEVGAKAEILQLVSALPAEKQGTFMLYYNSQRKNPTTAVILALLLGSIGGHKFYLGQTGLGIVYLLFCWTSIPMVLGFIEAFTISRTVFRMNREAAREAAAMLGGNITASFRI